MDEEADKLARWLKALSVGTRVRIVQILKGRALCVNALAQRLDVTQSAVSQHLRILREAGLVIDEKRGYYVHYRLDEETFAKWKEKINLVLDMQFKGCPVQKGDKKCAAVKRKATAAKSRKT